MQFKNYNNSMLIIPSNKIKTAINRIGGPTKAANTLGVSGATIHSWIKSERVPDIEMAKKLAKLADIDHEVLRRVK